MSSWALDGLTLDRLVDLWLADLVGQVDPETGRLYRLHWVTHLLPHFGAPESITTARMADYGRRRLRVVKRSTLQKERSTLRGFLAWCSERGYLTDGLTLPALPRRAPGTPFAQRRRGLATQLSPEECRALIEALPVWSTPRHNRPAFIVRARFVVAYETTLRPATLDALSAPEHYSKGAATLRIADEIDKARFGRDVPLTDAARTALDSVAGAGLLFGDHDYRDQLTKAARKVLTPAKARTFTAYDLRHARLTELAETGNLMGAAYLAGHKHVTTTSIYAHPGFDAAERALMKLRNEPATRLRPAGKRNEPGEGRAKERTRTSTGVTPLAPQADLWQSSFQDIAEEATTLLRVAALNEPVEYAQLTAFARRVLEQTEAGRLALEVLEGGEHGPRRALELAQLVASEAGDARKRRDEGGK